MCVCVYTYTYIYTHGLCCGLAAAVPLPDLLVVVVTAVGNTAETAPHTAGWELPNTLMVTTPT